MNDLISNTIFWFIKDGVLTLITPVFTILLFNACINENRTEREASNKNTIVILLDSAHIDIFSRQSANIKYFDDNLIPYNHMLNLSSDTKVTIQTKRDYLDVAYRDKSQVPIRFLMKNGDSLLLSLKQKKPFFTLLNHRRSLDYDINYHYLKNDSLYNGKVPGIENYYYLNREINNPYALLAGDKEMIEELKKLKEKAYLNLKQESVFIDSLVAKGLMSKAQADYFQLENSFNAEVLGLYQHGTINFSDIPATRRLFSGKTYRKGNTDTNLLHYTFYDDLLDLFYQEFLLPKVGKKVNRTLYDTIYTINNVDENVKQSLLLKFSDNLLATLTVDASEDYLNFFNHESGNQIWTDHLANKHKEINIFSDELVLTNQNNDSFIAALTLFENKGKLMYVDLWAAWCLPCLKEIPHSMALANEYQDQEITFVYLSLDRNIDHWVSAKKKYFSEERHQSYYIDSVNQVLIREVFGIKSIPRYLLYDKQGKLIHNNAPRPGSIEIRRLIDQYLSG